MLRFREKAFVVVNELFMLFGAFVDNLGAMLIVEAFGLSS